MWRVMSLLYSIIGASLAGTAVIAALVMGYDDWKEILAAAAIGFVVGLPVSWYVAQQITE